MVSTSSTLEDLSAEIRAYHICVIERCRMVHRLHGCTDKTEENFLLGTTGFLTEEEAKEEAKVVVLAAFTEENY